MLSWVFTSSSVLWVRVAKSVAYGRYNPEIPYNGSNPTATNLCCGLPASWTRHKTPWVRLWPQWLSIRPKEIHKKVVVWLTDIAQYVVKDDSENKSFMVKDKHRKFIVPCCRTLKNNDPSSHQTFYSQTVTQQFINYGLMNGWHHEKTLN